MSFKVGDRVYVTFRKDFGTVVEFVPVIAEDFPGYYVLFDHRMFTMGPYNASDLIPEEVVKSPLYKAMNEL